MLCSELQAHLGTDPRQSLLPTSLPRMPSTEVLPPASQEDNRPIGCITETRTENSASSCILRANLFPSPLPHTHWVPFPPRCQLPAHFTMRGQLPAPELSKAVSHRAKSPLQEPRPLQELRGLEARSTSGASTLLMTDTQKLLFLRSLDYSLGPGGNCRLKSWHLCFVSYLSPALGQNPIQFHVVLS